MKEGRGEEEEGRREGRKKRRAGGREEKGSAYSMVQNEYEKRTRILRNSTKNI